MRGGLAAWAVVLLAWPGCELAGDDPEDHMAAASTRAPDSGASRTDVLTGLRAAAVAQRAMLEASSPRADDRFGWSVALSGDTLAVGAVLDSSSGRGVGSDPGDTAAPGSGAVHVFRREGEVWRQEAYLKASNAGRDDRFGWSVALSGDILAVGAIWEDSAATGVNGDQRNNRAPESGAVYVFRRLGRTWVQEAYLKASNTGAGDHFGYSLALSGDTLAVGAYREDSGATGVNGDQHDDSAPDSGAVYVFRRRAQRLGASWVQEAYLKASNTRALDEFGRSLALSGNLLAAGAYYEDSGATGVNGDQHDDRAPDSGAVYVFRRTGSTWRQEAYLKASNTDPGDWFGRSLALSGNLLAVGALLEASSARGIDGDQHDNGAPGSGAVYVFRHTGASWVQEAYLKASNADPGDRFGISLALAGNTLAVGAVFEASSATGVGGNQHDERAPGSGAVYLFSRAGRAWTQEAYLKASSTHAGDKLGISLALSGPTLAAGAAYAHHGAVYLFE